jgi:predicted enzyme related to lactoylglutathione lyase
MLVSSHGFFFLHGIFRQREASNQSMKPTAPLEDKFSLFSTARCRGLSFSR